MIFIFITQTQKIIFEFKRMADRRNISNKRDYIQTETPTPYISQRKLNCVREFFYLTGCTIDQATRLVFHFWNIGFHRGFRGDELCEFAKEKAYREYHGMN